ncbi:ATP-binding protein [Elusimicrobiota bacterium]
MNLLSTIQIISFLIYGSIAGYILIKNPEDLLNKIFAGILFCFMLWSFGMVFIQNTNVSKETALIINNITSFGWVSFAAFSWWFAVVFTENKNIIKRIYVYLLVIAVPSIFILNQWKGNLTADFVRQEYGWAMVWSDSVWFYLFIAYVVIYLLWELYLLYAYRKRTVDILKKKQARIIIICTVIPLGIGLFTDAILPKMQIYDIPNVGNVISLIWAFGVAFAINRYKFLAITPSMVSRNILETMSDMLVILDRNGIIIEVNDTACRILGYDRDDLIQKHFSIIIDSEKSDLPDVNVILNQKTENKELILNKQGGDQLLTLFSNSHVFISGESIGAVCIFRDISGQKCIDEKMIQQDKLASMGQMAASIVHEINNPIGVILTNVQMIKGNSSDAFTEEAVCLIEEAARRCKKIIKNLLKYSRQETNKNCEEMVNLNEIIDHTLLFLKFKIRDANIIIKTNMQEIPFFIGNSITLQQVISNIVSNGIDAIQSIKKSGIIEITTNQTSDFIVTHITDNGSGISSQNLEKIFHPFFTTKKSGDGTGLGLSISKEIIEHHNGTIEVRSNPGKGSDFIITIPVPSISNYT